MRANECGETGPIPAAAIKGAFMNTPNANASNTSVPGPSQAAPTPAQPPLGPPAMHTFAPNPFDNQPTSNNKALMIAGGAVGLGLMVVGAGLCFGGRSSPAPTPPAAVSAAPPSLFDEQRQMMREAMSMAKEAREAQHEHMERMRQAMQDSSGDGQPSRGE
jgi:hypothetical protein